MHIDEPVVLPDNAINDGKSQAGAFTEIFGGEKRFKQVCHDFLIHAAAVVTDREHDKIPGDKTRMFSTIIRIKGLHSCFNGDFSNPGNGIPGIHAQVGQDLVHLGRIHFDRP